MAANDSKAEDSPENDGHMSRTCAAVAGQKRRASETEEQREDHLAADTLWKMQSRAEEMLRQRKTRFDR